MSNASVEVLAEDVAHPEGPDFLPDGRLVLVEGYRSRIVTWTRAEGIRELARVGGKPYAVVVGSDEHLYVTQSGHVSGQWVGEHEAPPSIQKVSPDGSRVEVLCTEIEGIELKRPNDLAFGPDGRLYFTDPGVWGRAKQEDPGYVFVLNPDGTGEVVAERGPVFPNGIAFAADGSLLWSESTEERLARRRADGAVEIVVTLPEGHHAEGFKLDEDGNVWLTAFQAGGIHVVAPDGELLAFHETGGVPVNCAFRDGSLYIADFGPLDERYRDASGAYLQGRLLRMDVDVAGRPYHRGAIRSPKGA